MVKRKQLTGVDRQSVTILMEVEPDIAITFPEEPSLRGLTAHGRTGVDALATARGLVARAFPASGWDAHLLIRNRELDNDLLIPKGTPVSKAVGMLLVATGLEGRFK